LPCGGIKKNYGYLGGKKKKKTHLVNSVKTPPTAVPKTAPTGAPAEKVANASDRLREGGKACANIPSL